MPGSATTLPAPAAAPAPSILAPPSPPETVPPTKTAPPPAPKTAQRPRGERRSHAKKSATPAAPQHDPNDVVDPFRR
jgi:hypothetical protein